MNALSFALRIILFSFCFSLLAPQTRSFAQSLGRAGAFTRIGIGARAGSLGDAYVAAAQGPEAIYWNPAALANSPSWQVAVTQRRYSFGRNFTFAGATMPLGSRQALGLGWTGFRTGGIEARQTNSAAPDAYFSDDENAFALTWGYQMNSWLFLGAGMKFVHQNLFSESAFGYSGALGFLIKPMPRLALGGHWRDFVSSYAWSSGRQERFPRTFMLGMALEFTSQSLVTVDYHYSASNAAPQSDGAFRLGGEFRPAPALPLRLGYSQNAFNAGLGFEIPVANSLVKLDYNFSAQDGLNKDGHVLSFAVAFNRMRKSPSRKDDSDFIARFERSAQREAMLAKEVSGKNPPAAEKTQGASPQPDSDLASQSEPVAKTYITVEAEKIIARTGPGASFKALGRLRQGAKYEVLSKRAEWFEIRIAGNKSGWVHAEKVKPVIASKK